MTFFASVFTGRCSSHTAQVAKAKAGTGRMKNPSLWEKIKFETI